MRRNIIGVVKSLLQFAIPRGQFVTKISHGSNVYLTFDDGPDSVYTPLLLALLKKNNAKVTFFMVGSRMVEQPELTRQIVEEGHGIGLHTMNHQEVTELPGIRLIQDLEAVREVLRKTAGRDTNLYRPVRGRLSLRSFARLIRGGYRIIHWTKTYSDYLRDGTSCLQGRMEVNPMRPGDIILLHDNNSFTLEALESVLPGLIADGVVFEKLE